MLIDWISDMQLMENLIKKEKSFEIKPLTADYLKKRGVCCGNGCKNCPYLPKHTKGIRTH
jgi:hypothetical protein